MWQRLHLFSSNYSNMYTCLGNLSICRFFSSSQNKILLRNILFVPGHHYFFLSSKHLFKTTKSKKCLCFSFVGPNYTLLNPSVSRSPPSHFYSTLPPFSPPAQGWMTSLAFELLQCLCEHFTSIPGVCVFP